MKLEVKFSESNQSFTPQLCESDGSFPANFDSVQTIHGKDGVDGKSAYELAVENGFQGTKPEWLDSLHGKDGYTPQKGVDYFDGKDGYTPQKGIDYFDGTDGYTPVKGTDYFTEADKAEMVNAVIATLPKYDGEVEVV